jgi:transposase
MRRLREILRLRYEAGLTQRAMADACRIGLGTVSTYLQRATAAAVTWPLANDLDDAALEARLFARPAWPAPSDRALPDWRQLHLELKKSGVTLIL